MLPATAPPQQAPKTRENPIVTALKLQALLDSGVYRTQSELAGGLGLSRARVTQIMNLLKLPRDIGEFLADCQDAAIRRYFTEQRLRALTGLLCPGEILPAFRGMLQEAISHSRRGKR